MVMVLDTFTTPNALVTWCVSVELGAIPRPWICVVLVDSFANQAGQMDDMADGLLGLVGWHM
jgi:hypothetical protein